MKKKRVFSLYYYIYIIIIIIIRNGGFSPVSVHIYILFFNLFFYLNISNVSIVVFPPNFA